LYNWKTVTNKAFVNSRTKYVSSVKEMIYSCLVPSKIQNLNLDIFFVNIADNS